MSSLKKYLFWIMVLALFISHIRHLNTSPRGVHVWRQCNSLAVASNFAQEDMDLFHPRVDHRRSSDGVTGMNFPLYEYTLALLYKLSGSESWLLSRIYQFLLAVLSLYGFLLLCRELNLGAFPSVIASFALCWSPEFYYYTVTVLADMMALGSAIWAMYLYFRSRESENPLFLLFAFVLIAIAGLIKLQYLLFGLFVLIDLAVEKKKLALLIAGVMLALTTGVVINWYLYAIRLRAVHQLYDFGLFMNAGSSLEAKIQILIQNLVSTIPELLVGYALLPLFLVGLVIFIRKSKPRTRWKALAIFALLLAFHISELGQMKHHSYYMLPYILFSATLIGIGASYLLTKKLSWLVFVLVMIQLGVTKLRIDHRFSDSRSQLPVEFLHTGTLEELRSAMADSRVSLVGPDPSGCIYLFYMGTQGYNAFALSQLETETSIARGFNLGIIDKVALLNPTRAQVALLPKEFERTARIGRFEIFSKSLQ